PAAGNEGAEDRRNVGAEYTEGSPRKDRKWDAVLCASMGVEKHGYQYQDIAQEHGEESLLPVHATGNHAAREHVGWDVHAHGNPEGSVVVGAPSAALGRDGGEVLIIERAVANRCFQQRSGIGVGHWQRTVIFIPL